MVTSRFQLGLIATLAVGLGFSLSSSEAVGYPAGAAVSLGANPVVSDTGELTTTATAVFSVPDGQQLILTDVIVSARRVPSSGCSSSHSKEMLIETSSGDQLAVFGLQGVKSDRQVFGYRSGIVVAPGETVLVRHSEDCAGGLFLNYSISGYYAQP